MKRIAFNIDWDTENDDFLEYDENDDLDLPNEVEIPNDIDEEMIADYLSDTYGFCINSFTIKYV